MNVSAGSRATFNDDGTLSSITADEAFADSRGRVLIGKVELYPSGEIKSVVLGEPWTNSRIALPQNAHVRFTTDGGFESVVTSQSELWGGDYGVQQELLTHPNGQIKSLFLSQQSGIALDGVAYPEFATIEFDRDGRVLRDNFRDEQMEPAYPVSEFRRKWQITELLEATRIGVWDVPKNSVLFKDNQGVLKIVTASKPMQFENMELAAGHYEVGMNGTNLWLNALSKPFTKDGLYLPAETKVEVSIKGILSSANVIDGVKYNALKLKPGSQIQFHKSGLVKSMTLDVGAELADHTFNTFAEIEFEKSGELQSVAADEPVKISNIEFDGDWIFFHPSGKVRSGILNVSTRAHGILYAAGTELILDESGQIIHSWQRKPRWPDGKPPAPAPTRYTDSFGNVISVMTSRMRALRSQLMGPLNDERCMELFGEKDVAGKYPKKVSYGYSVGSGNAMSPAALGCGTTDEQAGILERY